MERITLELMPTTAQPPIVGIVSTDGRNLNVRHEPRVEGNRPFASLAEGVKVVILGSPASFVLTGSEHNL